MEEQMPQTTPPTPQDSLEQAPAAVSSIGSTSTTPVSAAVSSGVASSPVQSTEILTGSETLDAPSQQMTAENPGAAPAPQAGMIDVDPDDDPEAPHEGIFANRLFRKVFFASAALLGVVVLLALGGIGFQRFNKSDRAIGDNAVIAQIGDQNVAITQQLPAQANTVTLRNGVPTVVISGDLAVQGLVQIVGTQGKLTLDGTNVVGNQTITLPNASGEICLSSGNCAGAGAAATPGGTTTIIVQQAASTTPAGGVQSINGANGALSLQGTADQVVVTDAGDTITLSLPQSIGPDSSPQFTSINLSSVGTQDGFNICDASNNCNFANASTAIIQGGNMFNSTVRVGARDNFGLDLLTNNTTRLSITNNGTITLGGTPQDRLVVTSQITGTVALVFQGATDDIFATSLLVADPTAPRNIILPNADGTICLSSGNCSGGGGYGDVLNGGNNFNALMTLGTNDNYGLNLKTFNTNRITISNTGDIALLGTTAINANASFGQNSSSRLSFLGQLTGAAPLVFQGATDNAWSTALLVEDPTANRTILLPNADGTICLSSGNCSGPVGTGDVLQGGNNFGAQMVLGTNDNFGFTIKTNNTPRLTITNTGNATFSGDLTVQHNVVLGSTSTDRLTINGQILGGTPLVFQGATDNSYATYFMVADPTSNRSIILPNADGTICLSSGNCSTSGGAGDVLQGGNNFNATMILGTNDNFGFNLKTDNTDRVTISNTGLVTVIQDFHVNGNTVLGSDAADTVIMQAGNLYVPNNLNIDTYTMYIDSVNNKVGFGEIPLGSARVGILATNGGDGLNVNNGTSAGNILTLQDNGTTVVTVGNEGATTFRNKTNSTSSFQIQNAAGNTLLSTDTTTRTVSVNGGPSTYTFTNPGLLFGSSTQYLINGLQSWALHADMNDDGSEDIVTVGSGGVQVHQNNGNGTFATYVEYGPGNQGCIAAGDVNNDNFPDILTSGNQNGFRVYMNNGNGTLASPVFYSVGVGTSCVTTGDLNNDGWQDVVVVSQFNSWIAMNNGDGTFATPVLLPSFTNASTPAIGDLNNDGWQDIVIDAYQVFMNNGNGTFATPVTYSPNSGYFVLADFNGDGRPDMALASQGDNFVRVRMNNGNGTFASPVTYVVNGTDSRGIAAGDFNGDGSLDLILSNLQTSSVSVLLNNGNGTFAAKNDFPTLPYPRPVIASDFNHDGKADFATPTDGPRILSVYLSQGGTTTVRNSLSVKPMTSGDTGIYVQGVVSQTADLLRVADSTGAVNLSIAGTTGAALFKNSSDSSAAFQIQNAAGTTLFNTDTTGNKITMFTSQAAALGAWQSGSNLTSGQGGGRARSVISNGNLYTITCTGSSVGITKAVINGNGSIGSWSVVGSSPAALQDCGVFAENGYLYIVGGYNVTTVYYAAINPDGSLGSWQNGTSLPATRAHTQPVVHNGRVYIIGGQQGGDVSGTNTSYYATINPDGSLGAWQTGTTLPYNSIFSGITVMGEYIYAIGGRLNRDTLVYAAINPDGSLGAWQTNGATLPATNQAMGLAVYAGKLYMFGGCTGSSSHWATQCGGSDTFSGSIYSAIPEANGSITGWQYVSQMPYSLAGFGNPPMSAGRVYIAGGFTDFAGYGQEVIYVQLPSSSTTGGVTITASNSTFTSNVIVQQASGANLLSTDIANGTLTVGGSVLAKNVANSTTAFQIQNANGDTLFNADTTNKTISLGAASATPTLFVIGNKNTAGDPTGTPGAMYYNSSTNKFRCYQNSAWADCIGSGSGSGDISQGGNSFGQAITIGAQDNYGVNILTNNTTTFSLSNTGAALFKNASNSTGSFQIQNAAGANLMNVDTSSNQITMLGNNSGEVRPWSTATNPLPVNRYGVINAVTANGYMYVIGGGVTNLNGQSTVYYAKVNTDGSPGAWATTTALPDPRASQATIAANGYIYVIGGTYNGNVQSTVYYAKVNADGTLGTWGTTNALPGERSIASSAVANGYVYIMGGADNNANGQSTVYYAKLNADGTLGAWNTNVNVLPANRRGASSVVANGYVYVIGNGSTVSSASNTVYYAKLNADGSTAAWSTAANALPDVRWSANAMVSNGYVYVIGGSNDIAGTAVNTVYYSRLNADGSVGTWSTAANALPDARYRAAGLAANGYMYIIGGRDGTNTSQATVYYTRTSTLTVAGNLDLVGIQGQDMADPGSPGTGATGGALTAGNGTFVGTLQVQGQVGFANSLSVAGSLNVGSQANFRNDTNSTLAFQIQNAAGISLFTADTTNNTIAIGGAASASPTLFVLSTKNTAGDPASTINGSMYYNSDSGRFRCYQNNMWTDCIGSGMGTGDISQGGNSFGQAITIGTNDGYAMNFETGGITRVSINATEATMRVGSSASGAGKIILDDSGSLANEAEIYSDNTASLNFRAYANNSDINMLYGGGGAYGMYLDGATGGVGIGVSTPGAKLHVLGNAAASPALIVQGAASQSTNILEVKDNANATLVRVNSVGNLVAAAGIVANGTQAVGCGGTSAALCVNSVSSPGAIGAIIQAASGQSVNLLEIRASNNDRLAAFGADGQLNLNRVAGSGVTDSSPVHGDKISLYNAGFASNAYGLGVQNNRLVLYSSSSATAGISFRQANSSGAYSTGTTVFDFATGTGAQTNALQNANNIGLTIKGANSQSANLQEWQNNNGDVLAAVGSGGQIVAGGSTPYGSQVMMTVYTNNGTSRGLVIRGGSTQTGDLQQWRAQGGSLLSSVNASGELSFGDTSSAASAGSIRLQNTGAINARNAANNGDIQLISSNVSNQVLVANGGHETLFGGNVALATGVVKLGVNVASTGVIRLANGTAIYARNAANSGDIQLIGTDSSDNINIASGGQQTNIGGNLAVTGSLTAGSPIAVTSGGTGAGSFVQYGLLFGNGTGTLQAVPVGNSGQCLTGNTGGSPTWGSCTPGGTGDISQGGNSFGMDMTLGTIDGYGVNILTNNVATFKLSSTGAATFQNASNSATAFQIQNQGGVSLFNVDSANSRIYIGNATPDGVGTLLVLDNKNTSGDPAGVDGGMYYNSNLGKFRCYENGEWKDCVYSMRTASKPSDQTFGGTAYSSVNGLSFNVLANKSYSLQCSLLLSVPVGTNGGNVSMLGPGTPGQYTATFAKAVESSGDNYATSSTFDDGSAATSFRVNTISTGSNRFIISYNAILNNGGSAGTWQLRAKAADGSSSITFYANSSCDMKPL